MKEYKICECCEQPLLEEHLAVKNNVLNIHGRSKDPRARLLSPLAGRPFRLAGLIFSSFEGFYQGIKFSEDDPRRYEAFVSAYGHAKRFRSLAENKFAWWGGEQFPYMSIRHLEVIKLGGRASIEQCSDRLEALLSTKGMKLIHVTKEKDNQEKWNSDEFCLLLEQIRVENS